MRCWRDSSLDCLRSDFEVVWPKTAVGGNSFISAFVHFPFHCLTSLQAPLPHAAFLCSWKDFAVIWVGVGSRSWDFCNLWSIRGIFGHRHLSRVNMCLFRFVVSVMFWCCFCSSCFLVCCLSFLIDFYSLQVANGDLKGSLWDICWHLFSVP